MFAASELTVAWPERATLNTSPKVRQDRLSYALVITKPKISTTSQNSLLQSQLRPWVEQSPLSSVSKTLVVPFCGSINSKRNFCSLSDGARGCPRSFFPPSLEVAHATSTQSLGQNWSHDLAQSPRRLGSLDKC